MATPTEKEHRDDDRQATSGLMTGNLTHRYQASCSWEGSTGAGYDHYDRTHEARALPSQVRLEMSSDPSFHGNPKHLNPEQLLLVAAASCQLLSFLAVAARARIDVIAYEDSAEAVMPESGSAVRITEICLHPRITVRAPATEARVRGLVDIAHRECFIANSLNCEMTLAPTVVVVGVDGG